jgi:hypothetical protein
MQEFSDIKPNFFLRDIYHNYYHPILDSIIGSKDIDELIMPLLNKNFQFKFTLNF